MDAPPSRYRVEEKDGRLIVIDNHSGAPLTPLVPSLPGERRRTPASSPLDAARVALDRAAAFLVATTAREFTPTGHAVIRWEWRQKGGATKHWNATLDGRQQRRLGRALLALCAFPLTIVIILVAGLRPATLLGVAPILWGTWAISRLQAETRSQQPPGV